MISLLSQINISKCLGRESMMCYRLELWHVGLRPVTSKCVKVLTQPRCSFVQALNGPTNHGDSASDPKLSVSAGRPRCAASEDKCAMRTNSHLPPGCCASTTTDDALLTLCTRSLAAHEDHGRTLQSL